MKLVRKLTLTLVLAITAILAVHGYIEIRREIEHYETDMREDQRIIGRVLRPALTSIWRSQGEARALALLDYADEGLRRVGIRWVWLDALEGDPHRPRLGLSRLEAVARGQELSLIDDAGYAGGRLYTYVPVAPGTEGDRVGAIELSESLAPERGYLRASVVNELMTATSMVVVAGAIALVAGIRLVGRPMGKLVEQARRVGSGDLSSRLTIPGRDEIGELAAEMNVMCDRLAKALEQLRHADRLATVGKLASGVAHELGTPLNVVSGRAKMIASGEVSDEGIVDNARVIVQQSERMTKIIRGLLDFARRRPPQTALHDLREIARHTLALLQPLAEKRGAALTLRGEDVPLLAEVDVGQLQQVVTNLVVNGIQAMPRGGNVTVGVRRAQARPPADHGGAEGAYLRLDVQDEGEGIRPEHIPDVFEPFFTTKEIGEGTGLGLSVAYGIVKEHGGWIEVESELGKGSRFSIYVPQRKRECLAGS